MADEDLKKLLGEDTDTTPPEKEQPKAAPLAEDQERKAKEEQLSNLNKAIGEAQDTLRKIRKEAKKPKDTEEDEDIPKINDEDPSAKAWNKRIKENVAPMQAEFEKEKDEIRTFALKEFLSTKPSLANNPERLKQMMATYEKIKTSSERTKEGVLMDLNKSYAAEFSDELLDAARRSRIDEARNNAILSDIAVSRGTTIEREQKPEKRVYSEEEKMILARWELNGAPKLE